MLRPDTGLISKFIQNSILIPFHKYLAQLLLECSMSEEKEFGDKTIETCEGCGMNEFFEKDFRKDRIREEEKKETPGAQNLE